MNGDDAKPSTDQQMKQPAVWSVVIDLRVARPSIVKLKRTVSFFGYVFVAIALLWSILFTAPALLGAIVFFVAVTAYILDQSAQADSTNYMLLYLNEELEKMKKLSQGE